MRIEVNLKLRAKGWKRIFGSYIKKKVGLRFEHYAWFFAFDYHEIDPYKFDELNEMDQLASITHGAAKWDAMERGKKFSYTVEDMKDSLMKASMETNERIGKTMASASWPDWMKEISKSEQGSGAKKK